MNYLRMIPVLVVICAMSSTATMAISADYAFPRAMLNPSNPTERDSVSMRYLLGIHPNSCVPVYTTSVSIDTHSIYCFTTPCPQEYVLNVQYGTLDDSSYADRVCAQVMTPYGPEFVFGKLSAGNYFVINGGDTLLIFSIASDEPVSHRSGFLPTNASGPVLHYSPLENILTIRLIRDQDLSINAALIDGKKVRGLTTQKHFLAGSHRIALRDTWLGKGVLIVRVKGNVCDESIRIVHPAHTQGIHR